jgi:hypothetical protein
MLRRRFEMGSFMEWTREKAREATDNPIYRLSNYLERIKKKYDLDLWDRVFVIMETQRREAL